MRILYIEDNLPNYYLVERIAGMGPHDVMHLTNADDALVYLDQHMPDLLLVDIRLDGDLDGLAFMRAARAAGCGLPIIVLTAYATETVRARCLEAGCDAFLTKPLNVRVFWKLLQHIEAGGPAALRQSAWPA